MRWASLWSRAPAPATPATCGHSTASCPTASNPAAAIPAGPTSAATTRWAPIPPGTPRMAGNVVRNFAVASTLADNLKVLPGYGLRYSSTSPPVTAPAAGKNYTAGQPVTGTVPAAPASAVAAGSKVRVTVRGEAPVDVPVDAGGNWSFEVPAGFTGKLRFTAETVNGFSTSGPASFSFAAPPAVPAGPCRAGCPGPTCCARQTGACSRETGGSRRSQAGPAAHRGGAGRCRPSHNRPSHR